MGVARLQPWLGGSRERSRVAVSGAIAFKKKDREEAEKKDKAALAASKAAIAAAQRALNPQVEKEMRQEQGSLYRSAPDMSDADLHRAKTKFFEADQDGSGSIDMEELISMLHADGKIGMREFLQWCASGMKKQRDVENEDVADAYRAIAGVASPAGTKLSKEALRAFLLEEYTLEYTKDDIEKLFDLSPAGDSMLFEEFQKAILTKQA